MRKITFALMKALPNNFMVAPSSKKNKKHTNVKASTSNSEENEDSSNEELIQSIIEVYQMSEEMFGSSYVLHIPNTYMCLQKKHAPTFLQSSVYQEQAVTGEALLRDLMNPPPAKRQKTNSLDKRLNLNSSSRKPIPISPLQTFLNYRLIVPRNRRHIPISVRGCRVWSQEQLKNKFKSQPNAPVRTPLLEQQSQKKIGKMPHCTFSRPLHSPLRPGYSIQYLIL